MMEYYLRWKKILLKKRSCSKKKKIWKICLFCEFFYVLKRNWRVKKRKKSLRTKRCTFQSKAEQFKVLKRSLKELTSALPVILCPSSVVCRVWPCISGAAGPDGTVPDFPSWMGAVPGLQRLAFCCSALSEVWLQEAGVWLAERKKKWMKWRKFRGPEGPVWTPDPVSPPFIPLNGKVIYFKHETSSS